MGKTKVGHVSRGKINKLLTSEMQKKVKEIQIIIFLGSVATTALLAVGI